MESFSELPRKIKRAAQESGAEIVLGRFNDAIEAGSWPGLQAEARRALDEMGIRFVFELEKDSEGFAKSREHLLHDGGIVIANHPGVFEVGALVLALDREDVRILTNPKLASGARETLGAHIVRNSKKPAKARKIFGDAVEHVRTGGVFAMFPTGGRDSLLLNRNPSFEFGSGLRFLLQHGLEPMDMVYSFYLNPEDCARVLETRTRIKTAVHAAMQGKVNLFKSETPVQIRVQEKYSTAKEWQEAIIEKGKGANRELEDHFLAQFK